MWIQLKFFIPTIELILNLKLGLGHNVYIRCSFETFMSTISLSSVVLPITTLRCMNVGVSTLKLNRGIQNIVLF